MLPAMEFEPPFKEPSVSLFFEDIIKASWGDTVFFDNVIDLHK